MQFNAAERRSSRVLEQLAIWLGQHVREAEETFEILDCTGLPNRDCKRRGPGWLPEIAALG